MRSLPPEEAELWAKVAATIRPLSRNAAEAPKIETARVTPIMQPKGAIHAPRPGLLTPKRIKNLRDATLDGGWDRRLRGGRVEPDRIVDLHGYNLDRAWQAIDASLARAITGGERVLLLITGHERKGDPPLERGRIRAAVHDWLAHSRHASRIAAVRSAHLRHGGGGSLYVILRKR